MQGVDVDACENGKQTGCFVRNHVSFFRKFCAQFFRRSTMLGACQARWFKLHARGREECKPSHGSILRLRDSAAGEGTWAVP